MPPVRHCVYNWVAVLLLSPRVRHWRASDVCSFPFPCLCPCPCSPQGCLVAPTLSVGAVLLQQAAASMAFHYGHAEILESQPPGAPQVRCPCWRKRGVLHECIV